MHASPRAAIEMQQSHDDEDALDCPALLDLEGNFISSFLCDAAPFEPEQSSPYPYASNQPDSSRTLTRLTQRLVLDVSTRKQGGDAYVSSSSDAEEGIAGSFDRDVQVSDELSGAKEARAVVRKIKAVPSDGWDERHTAGETRRRTKLKKPSATSSDELESDKRFVRSDHESISEYDDEDNQHTYTLPSRSAIRKRRQQGLGDVSSSDGDHGDNLFSASRASARIQSGSSSSRSDTSDDDGVFDLTLSRRGTFKTIIFTHSIVHAAACQCSIVTTTCSRHSPRKNRARTVNLPPKRQSRLNFAASISDSGTRSRGTAASRDRVSAASAHSRDSFDIPQQLLFCALADVKPTRIFSDNCVRTWTLARLEAWQNRSKDIHSYLTHLPFPHDGTSTMLHTSKQWDQCESDRLLSIIDNCIQNGVCVMNNWSYIAFQLRCRNGHQCATHFKNLIVAGHVPQEKYTLSCRGASAAFIGEEEWAKCLADKWQEVNMRGLQASIEKVLSDAAATRVSRPKNIKAAAYSTHDAQCKDYASKMFKIQVLRVIPRPRMAPIQILPPDFPQYYPVSEKRPGRSGNNGRGQENSGHFAAENVQIYQPGTASKGAPNIASKSRGEQGKAQGQRRAAPTTLREANDAAIENASVWNDDMADQDFSRTLSSRSTVSANNSAQSGIVLVLRDFMGRHTIDIMNMILQGAELQSDETFDVESSTDAKDKLLQETKSLLKFSDALVAEDVEARMRRMQSEGTLFVGSCKKVYCAVQSIVADDAHLVREDIMSVALVLCDGLQFSTDAAVCWALRYLVKALMKLQYITPKLLDMMLVSCICMMQDNPVLLEHCGSPSEMRFSRAYIQLFLTMATAFTHHKPGLWESMTKHFCVLSNSLSTVSFEWFWECVCVGVGCMQRLKLQEEGENTKLLTALFMKLMEVTNKEFKKILETYSVHRANNYAITMMERMMFLLEFCSSDTKSYASVLSFSCVACYQCKADNSVFFEDISHNSSSNLPWESLRGQLLQRPCAAFSILFEKLAMLPSFAQKTERARANLFLSFILEAVKNEKMKYAEALKASTFGAARQCRHVLRLICKRKAFLLHTATLHSGCTNSCLEILDFFENSHVPVATFSDAMTALQLFIDPLVRSFPSDIVIQDHDVIKRFLGAVSRFRGNADGQAADSRYTIEFRTKISCFVVSILKDFCLADCFFSEGHSVVKQLLEFVEINIRNLFFETNRLSAHNQDLSCTLVTAAQLESALSGLCSAASSFCVHADDAINVIANKIFVSRAVTVAFFKEIFESDLHLPCSALKCCVTTFHRLITSHLTALNKLDQIERNIQSLQDEIDCVSSDIWEREHSAKLSDSNEDMDEISSLLERKHSAVQELEKEQKDKRVLADSLRRACAQLPDSLIWHLHGLTDQRDHRFKVSEDLSQICMQSFTLEWCVRARMDDVFKTNQSPWRIWFKFFGPESTFITIVSGMRLKFTEGLKKAGSQRLLPLRAALFIADASSGVVTAHPEQFLRVWLLFALDVKCPKQEKHSFFNSLCNILFPHLPLPLLLATPFSESADDCTIVSCQISHLLLAMPCLSKVITTSVCGFIESAVQFGLGCLQLVPDSIRSQQPGLSKYFCRIAALLCKSFWREMLSLPSHQSKPMSALICVISELFILPPKFLHDSSGVRLALEDLVNCCLAWAEVDHPTASDTLYQIVRAQLQFLVSESGLPSQPQSAVYHIVQVLCSAATMNAPSHVFVVQTIQCLARSAVQQMTRDIRCLCFHVVAACLYKLLAASVEHSFDGLFDNQCAEVAAVTCCQTFVELLLELSNGVDPNFADALAEMRTCASEMCKVPWPSTQPPVWLVLMVQFIGCSLLNELISIFVPKESISDKDLCASRLRDRIDASQTVCLLRISRDLRSSISKPKTLQMPHHAINFLMFLTSLCDSAPHAFSRDMQMAASCIASHFTIPGADSNALIFGEMLLHACSRHGFASAAVL